MKKFFLILPLLFLLAAGCNPSPTATEQNRPVVQNKQQERPSKSVTNKPASETQKPKDETANWKTHNNTQIGFSFLYPVGWKVDDQLKSNTGYTTTLDLFSSIAPYQDDALKHNVMKAQFQYHVFARVNNKDEFLKEWNKLNDRDVGPPGTIDTKSLVRVNNSNNAVIYKFSGGVSGKGYLIPLTSDYTRVLVVFVWNQNSQFEKVLSTFKLNK